METTPDDPARKRGTRSVGRSEIGRYGIVPLTVYERLAGNTTAIALYGLLAIHANTGGGAWPHQETLAEALGVSEPTIRREIKTLVAVGLLEVGARLNEKGRKIGNSYVVITPTEPITHDRSDGGDNRSPTRGDAPEPERSPTRGTTDHPRAPRGRDRLSVNSPNEQNADSDESGAAHARSCPSTKDRAREITRRVWEARNPKPAQPFVAVCKIAERMLEAGHDDERLYAAMLQVPTISTGWLEGNLNGHGTNRATNAAEEKQAMIDRRFGFTKGQTA